MKTNKKNDEAFRHSKRPLHRGRGGGGAMSTGAEQIHEYPWITEVFARVRRSSAAEKFRSRSTLLSQLFVHRQVHKNNGAFRAGHDKDLTETGNGA